MLCEDPTFMRLEHVDSPFCVLCSVETQSDAIIQGRTQSGIWSGRAASEDIFKKTND